MENTATDTPLKPLTLRKTLIKTSAWIFWMYTCTVLLIFAPIFNWQYASSQGVSSWLRVGGVVSTAKAVVWPFYLHTMNGDASIHIKNAMDYVNEATVVRTKRGDRYHALSKDELDRIHEFYAKALNEARQADIAAMNRYFPGFGDHFKTQFTKGLEMILKSRQTGEATKSIGGQMLMEQWDAWCNENLAAISKKK